MNKQIEEMAQDICKGRKNCAKCSAYPDACKAVEYAERYYAAGYRRQNEGRWEWLSKNVVTCTACGILFCSSDNADAGTGHWKYCPHCGAKMKHTKGE